MPLFEQCILTISLSDGNHLRIMQYGLNYVTLQSLFHDKDAEETTISVMQLRAILITLERMDFRSRVHEVDAAGSKIQIGNWTHDWFIEVHGVSYPFNKCDFEAPDLSDSMIIRDTVIEHIRARIINSV